MLFFLSLIPEIIARFFFNFAFIDVEFLQFTRHSKETPKRFLINIINKSAAFVGARVIIPTSKQIIEKIHKQVKFEKKEGQKHFLPHFKKKKNEK